MVELTEEEVADLKVHCSPIGIIPKKNKWRLIVDLSFPEDANVNNGNKRNICSLSYISVDMVGNRALALRRGAL